MHRSTLFPWIFRVPIIALSLIFLAFCTALGQPSKMVGSLSIALRPDGSFMPQVEGSFDASGYRLIPGPNGEPRLVDLQRTSLGSGCGDSWDTSFALNGSDDPIYAVAGDGAGNVYVGGSFTAIGSVAAKGIARWDGKSWSALGSGVDAGIVTAIAVSGTDVYVGGNFTSVGGMAANRIAKWNGTAWSTLGSGLGSSDQIGVRAIAVSGGTVYAGGSFNMIGGSPVGKWDGVSWTAMGSGIDGSVSSVAIYNGEVYIGGNFNNASGSPASRIAKWNGTAWAALGSGIQGRVLAMTVYGGELIVGGTFLGAGGVSVNNIAKWNGTSFSALGAGVTGGPNEPVFALSVVGSDLYVGGNLTAAGGSPAGKLAKWNGSQWSAVGAGVGTSALSSVYGIAAAGSTILIGGTFTTAGSQRARNVALVNGTTYSAFPGTGPDGVATAIAVSGTDVYVAGSFFQAGSAAANRIAKWDGTKWTALGSGLAGDNVSISALAVAGNKLYVGGLFSNIGGVPAANIAVWNGISWSAVGSGVNARVSVIVPKGEDVYVGGDFQTAGGVPANRVAKWNGTTWSGLNSTIIPTTVTGMAFLGNDLYVGTATTTAANPAYFSKYDGTTWTALGADLGDRGVHSIAVIGNDVYVAGAFTSAGPIAVNRIAKWNGTSWSALGSGLPQPMGQPGIIKLGVSGSDLIAVGDFTLAGDVSANRVARWNGSAWSPLGNGLNGTPGTITVAGGDIFLGGGFTTAGCNLSPNFARWRETLWTGTTNSDWHTATNWGSGAVPPANAGVSITSAHSTITAADVTVSSLIIGNGKTLNIAGGRTLTVTGRLDVSHGAILGPGALVVNGDVNLIGGDLGALSSVTIHGTLYLNAGTIFGTNAHLTSCRPGAVVGGNATSFVMSPFTRCVNSSGTYRFPVGNTMSVYAPVELSNIIGSGNFTVESKSGAYPGDPTGLPTNRLQHWWETSNAGITQADITFNYVDSAVVGRENWYRAYRITGDAQQMPTAVNTSTNRMTVAGVTSFSSWTLAEGTSQSRVLAGRVTSLNGRGVAAIIVSLTDDQGNTRYTMTNPFGYYRFQAVQTFRVYTVTVIAKKFTFTNPQRQVEFDDLTPGVNFVSSDN